LVWSESFRDLVEKGIDWSVWMVATWWGSKVDMLKWLHSMCKVVMYRRGAWISMGTLYVDHW